MKEEKIRKCKNCQHLDYGDCCIFDESYCRLIGMKRKLCPSKCVCFKCKDYEPTNPRAILFLFKKVI
jgi:hypothetical protein